jgi:aspartyl-tRNA(Asn)/glutamyl-tRNA(Gln) amidotransferase subunit C
VKITESEVRYVADLANLKLTDSEIARLAKDLDEILTHMDALNELDTSDIEPMAQVLYQSEDAAPLRGEETATLRADAIVPPIGNEAALANAPLAGGGYYKVPKVIER